MYPEDVVKKACVAVKFLMAERVKSLWIIKFVEDPNDLSKVENVTIDITDKSDMPKLTALIKGKKARRIIRERKHLRYS
jgi:hypothetical protein